jgi:hypothetical protein
LPQKGVHHRCPEKYSKNPQRGKQQKDYKNIKIEEAAIN